MEYEHCGLRAVKSGERTLILRSAIDEFLSKLAQLRSS